MSFALFNKVSSDCSKIVTKTYSSSFASAIHLLHKDIQGAIYNIYGFVRFADEIVDTFHEFNKIALLNKFKSETFEAIEEGISLNPILQSFQETVNKYKIDQNLIHDFFESMEADLQPVTYNEILYKKYIYGSAEVVGLICLYIFCEGNRTLYNDLKFSAGSLGAAFQKVNFLRDMKSDYLELSRIYFPKCNFYKFNREEKLEIERDIEEDFRKAYKGIMDLPGKAKFGVYVAYQYYYSLFRKIKKTESHSLLQKRIRVPDYYKAFILFSAGIKNKLRLI